MNYLRTIAVILLLCTLCGCAGQFSQTTPIYFYYLRSDISYTGTTGVISSDLRDDLDPSAPLLQILEQYLSGPDGDDLLSPFPEDIEIVSAVQKDNLLLLEFNDRLSSLSGMDLTLACACITKTCLGLTDATSVSIRSKGAALDGAAQITMTADSLLLLDSTGQ